MCSNHVRMIALAVVLVQATGMPCVRAANVAQDAQATASESFRELTPEKAVDGDANTRWSAIPGHEREIWFQLEWQRPVRIAEVVIQQYETYVMELDLEVWSPAEHIWVTLCHRGRPEQHLAKIILSRFEPVETTRLRIAHITGGPSFQEVAVYEKPCDYPLSVQLASDLRGNFIGMVSDPWGAEPVGGATVNVSGHRVGQEWQSSAASDENGLFVLPMPVGLEGTLRVKARAPWEDEGRSTNPGTWEAIRFQYGLTPLGEGSNSHSLNGTWKFLPDPSEDFFQSNFDDTRWPEINVPAHWVMEGFTSISGMGGYRKRFTAPPGEGRVKLRFEGVYSAAEVWINGYRLAHHEGGLTPFEVDVTGRIRPGTNLLALRVAEETTTSLELDKASHYADFSLAGIIRAVSFFRVPAVYLGEMALSVHFDAEYRDAVLQVRAAVINHSQDAFEDGRLMFQLIDPTGEPVPAEFPVTSVAVHGGARWEKSVNLSVKAPSKWDAEHPVLYQLAVQLWQGERLVQSVPRRFGFRQVEIKGSEIHVNGRAVKLKGTCHHDTHPLMGRAVTPELTRRDLEMIKGANLNALRTSHYPPIPELPRYADELGLYVEDEAPFCWAQGNDDLNRVPRIIQLTAEMLARDRNHPSVIFWSMCNESRLGKGFRLSQAWVRAEDPSRPTTTGGLVREISTLHNPLAISRMDEHEALKQPLVFDESLCIFQGIFHDAGEMWVDPGIRDYYAQPLGPIYDRFMRSRATQGSMIWCWADDIFCVPGRGLEYGRGTTKVHFLEHQYRLRGRGLVGDAPWGVVDGWRREKPEYWIVKKLHSPVRIREGILEWPTADGAIHVPVENQYDFTSLSELRIRWTLAGQRGMITADVSPHAMGELLVRPNGRPQPGAILELEFVDPSGHLVDAFRLPLGGKPVCLPDLPEEKAPLRIFHEDVLAGRSTVIKGEDFELGFDHGGGYADFGGGFLRRSVAFGESFLMDLPTLHLLPAETPESPIPRRLGWKKEDMSIRAVGDDVEVLAKGSYPDFQGTCRLRITRAAEVFVEASFEYKGPEMYVREVGLCLSLPRDCDCLLWDRNAEWSVYPDDHIGRPRGIAQAFAPHDQELPPAWPWSHDNTALGSNDFRSTKRHINHVVLRYPDGPGVLILSDGAQHVRAMVEGERITLHVNDWYGGTNAGLWEWVHNYGKGRKVVPGEVVSTRLNLRFVDARALNALYSKHVSERASSSGVTR